MAEFVRARSAAQKEIRMTEIKEAADRLFCRKPYHEITLTTIAAELSWTRANVYKYVTSKEEIFLELCGEKMAAYMDDLLAACPEGCGYSAAVFAEVWAAVVCAHEDYFRYSEILSAIIETNVSVQRLAAFKTQYHGKIDALCRRLARHFAMAEKDAAACFFAVHYHAVGLGCLCRPSPLVKEALALAGLTSYAVDFRDNMKAFIAMNLQYYSHCKEAEKK